MTTKVRYTFKDFINEQTAITPRTAVKVALEKWEKAHNTKFEPEDKKRLLSILGKKIYTKPFSAGLTVFEYIKQVSGRQEIEFRQMFKDFDELYDILSKSSYDLYKALDENKWSMRLNNKGSDLFYFLHMEFAKLK